MSIVRRIMKNDIVYMAGKFVAVVDREEGRNELIVTFPETMGRRDERILNKLIKRAKARDGVDSKYTLRDGYVVTEQNTGLVIHPASMVLAGEPVLFPNAEVA
ncbi:MAG: hypothetical protein ACRDBQ_18855 [Shewanella sp.]